MRDYRWISEAWDRLTGGTNGGVSASDADGVVPPSIEELLRAGRNLLEESRRLTESLDEQLRRSGVAAGGEPEPEPA